MIVGEAPGETEVLQGRPFVGASGWELDRMLHEVGLLRSEAFVTNVCRVRPPRNDIERSKKNPGGFVSRLKKQPVPGWEYHGGVWYSPEVAEGLALLRRELELCKPDVIIAFGNVALWALTGNWGIRNWRGSQIVHESGAIVVPSYHPAYVLRDWSVRGYVIRDLQRATKILREGPPKWVRNDFIVHPSFAQCEQVLGMLLDACRAGPTPLAADIETRSFNGGQTFEHIDCIGFAWSTQHAICIPLMAYGKAEGYWSVVEEQQLVGLMRRLLTHPNCLVIGQNWSYDAQHILRSWKFKPNLAWDTMVGHHVCWPGTPKALDVLSSLYCESHLFWKEDNKEANVKQDDNQRWLYNCTDCVRTYEIAEVEIGMVRDLGLLDVALFQYRRWHRTFETMVRGVRISRERKLALSGELAAEEAARLAWIQGIVGQPLNPKSPKQMKEFFYDDLQIKPVISRKTGAPTCDDEALGKIALREPLVRPILRRISEIRSIGVFKSTFVDAPLDVDGRMRSSYNVAGPETFRLSSSTNPFGSGANLQNLPEGGESADSDLVLPNIRALYIPDEGCEIFDTDLSSADPRIVAAESDCRWLKECFAAGLNPYVEIAKEYYRDPKITKKHPRYRTFKELINGTHYVGTAAGLAQRIGLSVAEVDRAQKWYFSVCPEIKDWHDKLRVQLHSTHTVANAWGYRRFFFDRIEGTVINQAAAWIPQSTIAILIDKIWDHLLNTSPDGLFEVLLQNHDAIAGQYPIDRREEAHQHLARACNEVPVPYPEPLFIPFGFKTSSKSWGDCK